jgi:hypothetical protein
MKNLKSILVAMLIAFSATAFAQGSKAKVTAVLNHATWCSICKINGERAIGTFTTNNTDGFFALVPNDISDDASRAKSKPAIVKVGLGKSEQANSGTAGIISFYDATTKKLLGQISVAHTDEEIVATLNAVRAKIKS